MTKEFMFEIDEIQIPARQGESIMEAADRAKVYIPRLCDVEGLSVQGSCRVCTVKLNGRAVAACTQPAEENSVVENSTTEVNHWRKDLVRMLFQEGNHMCPGCEASGNCELQAMAYRLGITQNAKFPYLQPVRPVDSSHPDIMIDSNRCILCGRCINASRDVDNKHIFEYVGRGIHKQIGINAENLAATDADINDKAFSPGTCPVGCILIKETGFNIPIGERDFDTRSIGSRIEQGIKHQEETQ